MKNVVALLGLETLLKNDGRYVFSEVFMNNVKTWRRDNPNSNLTIIDARDHKDNENPMASIFTALKSLNEIDEMYIHCHSDPEGLYIISRFRKELEGEQRYIDYSTDWSDVKFSSEAAIWLTGCQTTGIRGVRLTDCIAQDIANKTKVTVWGYPRKSSQKYSNGGYYQVPTSGDYLTCQPVVKLASFQFTAKDTTCPCRSHLGQCQLKAEIYVVNEPLWSCVGTLNTRPTWCPLKVC